MDDGNQQMSSKQKYVARCSVLGSSLTLNLKLEPLSKTVAIPTKAHWKNMLVMTFFKNDVTLLLALCTTLSKQNVQ